MQSVPANSISSWAELKAHFIKKIQGTCKQPLAIVDLDHCVQHEDESAHHGVRRVSAIFHSSDIIAACHAVLIVERTVKFPV